MSGRNFPLRYTKTNNNYLHMYYIEECIAFLYIVHICIINGGVDLAKKVTLKTAQRGIPKEPLKIFKCVNCGEEKSETEYYKAKGTMVWGSGEGYVLICKSCMQKVFDINRERYGERTSCILCCHYLDVPYIDAIYEGVIAKQGNFDFGYYLRSLNNVQWSKKSFATSILDGELYKDSKEEAQEVLESKWSAEEVRNRKEVINMLGTDPFVGYPDGDRKYLYGEIAKYLDEDTLDDAYRLSVIIQLVTNNCQIRNYDQQIAKLNVKRDADTIKKLGEMKSTLVSANDKLAKENEISVKNRTNKDAGKSTLTYLMKDLREKGLKEAQANYYDQLRSDGTLWAIDMSNKAILQNTFFDENDKQEVFIMQRNMIQDLQAKLDDVTEELRQAKIQIWEFENDG